MEFFPTWELNQSLLHCRWILYQLRDAKWFFYLLRRVESGGKFGLVLAQVFWGLKSPLGFTSVHPSTLSRMLILSGFISSCLLEAMKLLILEGVNVCASWLNQALYCLFTTKFSFGFLFHKNFCISYIPGVQNVACIFLTPGLRLERTSDNYGNYAFCCSSPGFLRMGFTRVCRLSNKFL